MNIQNKFFLAVASLLALNGAAFAQSTPNAGWYMGASVGKSNIKPDVNLVAGATQDKSSTGYKIMGGYQFNANWAVEGQYQNLGKYTASLGAASVNLKEQGLAVAAVGFLPVAKDFALIGKAGVASQHYKAGGLGSGSETKSSLLVGFGAEYNLTPNLVLRGEYEYFGNPNVSGTKIKSDLLSAGLRMRF